eukprot:TRINITY_DN17407_c0_g1_i1.p1 TRINITY_DN17407_c0_g1~~TRINITY_DN17407_c0_g1_i1.p1  ORF type:complete len:130 (+),score=10.62 TRINITY_DN17407_c0_g1_i1:81-470(+)
MPRLSQYLKNDGLTQISKEAGSQIAENTIETASSTRPSSRQRVYRQDDGSLSMQCPKNSVFSQISQQNWKRRVAEACLQSGVACKTGTVELGGDLMEKHPLKDDQHPFNSWFKKQYNYVMMNEVALRTP